MRLRYVLPLVLVFSGFASGVSASPLTLSFTAGDIKSIMLVNGDPLHDDTYQWGLWSVRAMPIVSGGGYDILDASISTTVDWWSAGLLSGAYASPYDQEFAFFYAQPGSEHAGVAAHPLNFIADEPASTFQSYAFDAGGHYTGVCTDTPAAPGCNEAGVLPDSTIFSFTFDLTSGASWLGWQFLVDGSKYYRPSAGAPDNRWVMDFIGGDGWLSSDPYRQDAPGGGLSRNVGDGYQVVNTTNTLVPVPEPATLSLTMLGLLAARSWSRRRARSSGSSGS
jgi:hypothetical protein